MASEWTAFVDAQEASETTRAFEALPTRDLKELKKSAGNYKAQRAIDAVAALRRAPAGVEDAPKIVVSGAGPVGLRAAVEAARDGARVVVVEKRASFSRVNILTLFDDTLADLVRLGAKIWYPQLKIGRVGDAPAHMGTREIQLALLKTALLLGVDVRYGTVLCGVRFDEEKQSWVVALSPSSSQKSRQTHDPLAFKDAAAKGDFANTFRCNAVLTPEVSPDFVSAQKTDLEVPDVSAVVVAEGEHSTTARHVGFSKSLDRFKQALGLVVNLKMDPNDEGAKKLPPLTNSAATLTTHTAVLSNLSSEFGLEAEALEYLRGTTHFVVASTGRKSLVDRGVLRSGEAGADSVALLSRENVDVDVLKEVALDLATVVGLDRTKVEFTEKNPIQIFDFSSRARAYASVRLVDPDGDVVDARDVCACDPTAHHLPFCLVGDALVEPFWPQGLGVNRGFHGALDAVAFALRFSRAVADGDASGALDALKDREFWYAVMHSGAFRSKALQPARGWTSDPLTRYAALRAKTIRDEWKMGIKLDRLSSALRDVKFGG